MILDIPTIKKQVESVLEETGVLKSSIFGSVARGEADEESDVDVLVELPQGKTLLDLVELQQKLQSVLGKKVDVGTL